MEIDNILNKINNNYEIDIVEIKMLKEYIESLQNDIINTSATLEIKSKALNVAVDYIVTKREQPCTDCKYDDFGYCELKWENRECDNIECGKQVLKRFERKVKEIGVTEIKD